MSAWPADRAGRGRGRGGRSRHERQVAADGTPNVVFVEEELARRFGEGAVRVICPITDPFVRHHGALGSFVRVYQRKAGDLGALMAACAELPGVEAVIDGPAAARRFGLPLDLEGDFVVLGDADTVVGASRADTISQAWPVTVCGRTAASASRGCRSSSRIS